jgi:phosphate transport system permease protein
MSLLILPVIIIESREAIKTVPVSIRYAAYSLGATKWQTTWAHVLPSSFPGIMTGVILALSRAIGETAPLVMIGALTFVAFRPQQEFHEIAAAGIIVLLIVLLLMNSTAIYIRNKTEKRIR